MDRWGRDMDAAAFERVYEAFGEFHSFFAPLFGRSESRDYSRNYLRALLVQSQDRRNAGNLSESVGVPPGPCSASSRPPPQTQAAGRAAPDHGATQ